MDCWNILTIHKVRSGPSEQNKNTLSARAWKAGIKLYYARGYFTWGLGMFFHFLYFQDGIHNFGICANKSCGHSPQRRHFRPQEFGETWHWLGHGENTWPRRWSEAGRYHVNHRVGNPSPDKERVNVLICNSDSIIESWWIDLDVPWKKTIKSLKANLNSLIVSLSES